MYRRNIWLTYKILRFWSIITSKTQNAKISARSLRSFVTIHFLKIAGLLENSKILGRSLRSLVIFYKFLTRVFFWSNWNNECCNTQGCYCADKICDWPWNKILRSRRMVCLRKKMRNSAGSLRSLVIVLKTFLKCLVFWSRPYHED